jgi:hypothetical protein
MPVVGFTDNPESIIRKQRVKRLAIRGQKSPLSWRIENDTSSCSVPTSDSTQPNHGVQALGLDDRAHLAKVETVFSQVFLS